MPLSFDGTSGFAAALGGAGQFGEGLSRGRASRRAGKTDELKNKILQAQAEREPLITENQKVHNSMLQEALGQQRQEAPMQQQLLGLELARRQGALRQQQADEESRAKDEAATIDGLLRATSVMYSAEDPTPDLSWESSPLPEGMNERQLVDWYSNSMFSDDEQELRDAYRASAHVLLDMKENGASANALQQARVELLQPFRGAVAAKRRQQSAVNLNGMLAELTAAEQQYAATADSEGQPFAVQAAIQEAKTRIQEGLDLVEQGKDPVAAQNAARSALAAFNKEVARADRVDTIRGRIDALLVEEKTSLKSTLSRDQHEKLIELKNAAGNPNTDPDQLDAMYESAMAQKPEPVYTVPGVGAKIFDPAEALWRGSGRPPARGAATRDQRLALDSYSDVILKTDPDLRVPASMTTQAYEDVREQVQTMQKEMMKKDYLLDDERTADNRKLAAVTKQLGNLGRKLSLLDRMAVNKAYIDNGFTPDRPLTEEEMLYAINLESTPGDGGGVSMEEIDQDLQIALRNPRQAATTLRQKYKGTPQYEEVMRMYSEQLLQQSGKQKAVPPGGGVK